MNNRYTVEFTQSIDNLKGLTESKVYLHVSQPRINGLDRYKSKIDLGFASSEEKADQIAEQYIHTNFK